MYPVGLSLQILWNKSKLTLKFPNDMPIYKEHEADYIQERKMTISNGESVPRFTHIGAAITMSNALTVDAAAAATFASWGAFTTSNHITGALEPDSAITNPTPPVIHAPPGLYRFQIAGAISSDNAFVDTNVDVAVKSTGVAFLLPTETVTVPANSARTEFVLEGDLDIGDPDGDVHVEFSSDIASVHVIQAAMTLANVEDVS